MYTKANCNKNNEIISYRLICSGQDFLTGKHKNFTKTWKVPKGLSNKEIKLQLKSVEVEFANEVQRLSVGLNVLESKLTLKEVAQDWLEQILVKNPKAFTYYVRAKDNLKVILPKLGDYIIQNINYLKIKEFYKYLCSRTYIKQETIVKKSIYEDIEELKIPKCKLAENIGINRLTLRIASTIGKRINRKTAKLICKYLQVPLEKYFDTQKSECYYAKATNESIKTTLVMIFEYAKELRLIDQNVAIMKKAITGTTKDKQYYNIEEARTFISGLENEKDIRKKAIFSLLLYLGLRRSEVCGLSFSDIDFQNKKIHIIKNSIYVRDFGVQEKDTKTKKSNRILIMPNELCEILMEYKEWWLTQQVIHGDLWQHTQRLFIQDNGKPINPCSVNDWLTAYELKNGLRHLSPHELRHTTVSLLFRTGANPKVVAEICGHESCNTTLKIYTHVYEEQITDYTNKLAENLKAL